MGVGYLSLSDSLALLVQPRPAIEARAPIVAVGGIHADLPASEREIARLKQFAGEHPVVELLGSTATPERLIAELPGAAYAHLATHGFFDEAALLNERRRALERVGRDASGDAKELDPHGRVLGVVSPYGGEPFGSATGLGLQYSLAYTGLSLAANPFRPVRRPSVDE